MTEPDLARLRELAALYESDEQSITHVFTLAELHELVVRALDRIAALEELCKKWDEYGADAVASIAALEKEKQYAHDAGEREADEYERLRRAARAVLKAEENVVQAREVLAEVLGDEGVRNESP